MVNSPMDIDMETQRKSMGPQTRKSRGASRPPSMGQPSELVRTPKAVEKEEAGTQTRRILKVKRRIAEDEHEYKPTSPSAFGMKRKLFGTPAVSPRSPIVGGNRSKQRRLAMSPIPRRKSSAPGTGRKSRSKRQSTRPPSASGPGRRSELTSAASGVGSGLDSMTVRQLKTLLTGAGVDTADCLEKQELIEKATRLGLTNPIGRPSVSSRSTPVVEPAVIPPVPTVASQAKRRSRNQSAGKVGPTALMEIARIEQVSSGGSKATCFDILGMSRLGACEASVKSRAKQLFRHVHPDKIHDNSGDLKQRAHNVFQLINQAVEEAMKSLPSNHVREPPKPPVGIKYSIERAGTVVLLRWRPDKSADAFRVSACLQSGFRLAIDQGVVANLPGDNGELEYALSTQSRAGNDELFRKAKFDVSVSAINAAGESSPMTISVDVTRPSSVGGLKRHHTIC